MATFLSPFRQYMNEIAVYSKLKEITIEKCHHKGQRDIYMFRCAYYSQGTSVVSWAPTWQLTTFETSILENLMPSSDLHWHCRHLMHIHTCMQIKWKYTCKNDINKSSKLIIQYQVAKGNLENSPTSRKKQILSSTNVLGES